MSEPKERDRTKKAKRTGPSVEEEILEALSGFTDALEKGEVADRFRCRRIRLDLTPTRYNPELVRRTRKLLKISQGVFAHFIGVSPKTVRAWELGARVPHPMACRFMDEIRHNPTFWLKRVQELTTS